MTDVATLVSSEGAPGSPPAAPPAAAVSPPAAAAPPAPASPPAADPGSDWRKMLAGEDDKSLKLLERYSDPSAFLGAHNEAVTKLTSKLDGMVKLPGEGASDEDRQAFAKAIGIPESPDKYPRVKPPEGLQLSEGDTKFIDGAIQKLHQMGGFAATPQTAEVLQSLYYEAMQEQAANMAAQAVLKKAETEKTLQKEWGGEFKINMGMAEEALRAFGGEGIGDLLEMQMADGTRLGDHAGFIKLLANAGRNSSEDVTFLKSIVASPQMGADAIDTEMESIRKWRNGSPSEQKRYAEASAPGGRLEQLMEMKNRVAGGR